ncbi:MAG: hypothetical protein QGI33_03395, partial [Candidatus Brocadiia bacterium]|nr:hypothetical protein [Candidatus Brocadiia bacterium]
AVLVHGLAAVSRRQASDEPVNLTNNNGTVTCAEGEFLARATARRMIVRCLRGSVRLASGDKNQELGPGQQAMFFRGAPVEPVRTASARMLAHWQRELDALDSGRVTPAESELLPLAAGPASLPDGVRVRSLAVELVVRGPLWMAVLSCELENTGSQAWRGRLDPARVLWPAPLCAVQSEEVDLPPGAVAEVRCAALGTMAPGGEAFLWSLPVDGWTRERINAFTLSVRATAGGGVMGAHSTGLEARWERSGDGAWGAISARDMSPNLPVVLALRFGAEEADDVLALPSTGRGVRHVLVASRGLVANRAAARGADRVLMVFDATADYGPLDRIFAHEIVEGMASRLKGGAWLGLVAYDGQMKNLPPARGMGMDGLLARLWALRGGEGELREDMLFTLASGPGDGSAAAFLITGVGPAAGAAAVGDIGVASRPGSAPHVVQVGAPRPGGVYRELCASAGGACTSTIGRLSPARQALRLLQAVRRPGLQEVSYAPGGGTARYRLLNVSGEPSDGPIVVALALKPRAEAVTGTLAGEAADAGFKRDLSIPLREAPPAEDDALATRLAAALNEWIEAGEGP